MCNEYKYKAYKIQCECGGYIKPGSMRQHLKTMVYKYRMKYPNGLKIDDKCGHKHIVVYKDYLTDDERQEVLHNHPGYDEAWTYRWYMTEPWRDIKRVYDITED